MILLVKGEPLGGKGLRTFAQNVEPCIPYISSASTFLQFFISANAAHYFHCKYNNTALTVY